MDVPAARYLDPVATGFASSPSPASSSSPRAAARNYILGGVAITILALAVRFPTLSLQSFWLDETYTEHLIHLGFGRMLGEIPKTESTPPVYYALAWIWTRVFGSSEFGLRSLSALAGALTVTLGYGLATRLGGLRAGLVAGVLLAFSPLMIWYSQEARAYSLAGLFATASVLCLVLYVESGSPRWLARWALTAALGLATHYFVVFVVAPELVWLLVGRPGRPGSGGRRGELPAAAFVLAIGGALIPLALAQRGTGHADYIEHGKLLTRLLQVPKQYLVGYASPGQSITAPLAALLVLAGALIPLYLARSKLRRGTVLTLVVGLCAVLIPCLLALVGIDFLDTRNVLPALPILVPVIAVGFMAHRGWKWGAALAAALAGVLLLVFVLVESDPRYQRPDWRGASQALGHASGPRAIVATPGSAQMPLQYYLPGIRVLQPSLRVRELDVIGLPSKGIGGGAGVPPKPLGVLPVPPGFTLVATRYTPTFSVLRFRSVHPLAVSPNEVARSHIGTSGVAALEQLPGR